MQVPRYHKLTASADVRRIGRARPGHLVRALLVGALLTGSGSMAGASDAPVSEFEGLPLASADGWDAWYAEPGRDLASYRQVYLETASVEFSRHWQRDQNRHFPHKVTNDDMARIRENSAGLLRDVFARELIAAGYEIVSESGPGVLVFKPAIVDLNIVGPDTPTPGRTFTYSEYSLSMRLHLKAVDGETGALVAYGEDYRRDHPQGWLEWRNQVSNTADARRALGVWARDLIAALGGPGEPGKA